MISFEPTEDQQMMRDTVAQFAERTLAPRVREFEKARGVPEDVREARARDGARPRRAARGCRRAGARPRDRRCSSRRSSRSGDAAAAFALPGRAPSAWAVARASADRRSRQAAELAPFVGEGAHARFGAVAWSERKAPRSAPASRRRRSARRRGWTLTRQEGVRPQRRSRRSLRRLRAGRASRGLGRHRRLRRPDATRRGSTSCARVTTRSASTRRASAASASRASRCADAARLVARTAEASLALRCRFFAKHALVVAARAVGLARCGVRDRRASTASTRKAFGKPIGHFQAVAFTLADRAMDVEGARASSGARRRAGTPWPAATRAPIPAPPCCTRRGRSPSRSRRRCAAGDDCVQLHGGAGFMRDYLVEKLMRDAKQIALCGMTAEHADQLAAALELGRPLDPALVLPTPETQNVFI